MRALLAAAIAALTVITFLAGCGGTTLNMDPGQGSPLPFCPQQVDTTMFAIGGVMSLPACGGYVGNMTYPAMSSTSDVNVVISTNIDPIDIGCNPTPIAVLWDAGIAPAADITLVAAPTFSVILPSTSVSSAFTYYYCVKDMTAGIPASPTGLAGVLNGSTAVFPSSGPWSTLANGHHYRIEFYRV